MIVALTIFWFLQCVEKIIFCLPQCTLVQEVPMMEEDGSSHSTAYTNQNLGWDRQCQFTQLLGGGEELWTRNGPGPERGCHLT
jgi:hypothetical protein